MYLCDKKYKIEAVDLFCGIDGLSYGLIKTGIEVKAGIDIDKSCKYPFETNCKVPFIAEDIKEVKQEVI